MPLVRIELRKGKPAEYRRTLAEQVYEAMRDAIKIPENDKFVVVSEHDPDNLVFDRSYLGIQRSDDFVLIQVVLRKGRAVEVKQAFYKRVVERLEQSLGVRPADVLVSLLENDAEDWSFGNGVAQYVK
jgi:phenylpyruvate tautomerase PptA (4-oxalocrotonate tautomerase family)